MATKKKKTAVQKFKGVSVQTQLMIVTGSVLLLVLFGGFVAWLDRQVDLSTVFNGGTQAVFGDVIIRGEATCLQHTGKGPHTLECATGIRTPSGDYQVIGTPTQSDNNTLEARGTLSSPARKNPYAVQGVIDIQK